MTPAQDDKARNDAPQGADPQVWAALYDELKSLARRRLRAESTPDLLQPTALVAEAWLRMANESRFDDRRHFLRMAARVMRHVLVDQARALKGPQRDHGALRVTLDSRLPGADPFGDADLLDIDTALARLHDEHARVADVLELHYFGGMNYAEMAEALAISEATVKRDLRSGRAWLLAELDDGAP
ncbi:MAG: sigma-70 family RNA polymerase sigma factor [Rhodanobacteraceae bacterium]|nr:sigma-70 family RNA polymerase sigma factor [Xanthomonadales bacterium]MCP5478521.1 sigma-70 family RNA polymerase sigma factor [Rhodanobacteraceae bacterium]